MFVEALVPKLKLRALWGPRHLWVLRHAVTGEPAQGLGTIEPAMAAELPLGPRCRHACG
jgi:hypothetical protein